MSLSIDENLNEKNKIFIKELIKNLDKDDEFEIMFNNYKDTNKLNMEQYLRLLEYINFRKKSHGIKIRDDVALDINYKKNNTTYRITIDSIDIINEYKNIFGIKNSREIYESLYGLAQKGEKNIGIMKKIKDFSKILDIDDLDMRIRVSKEKELQQLDHDLLKKINGENISFRFKQRITLILKETSKEKLYVDVTHVRTANELYKINKGTELYECELEYIRMDNNKTGGKKNGTEYAEIINEANILLKVLQKNKYIITNSLSSTIKNYYYELLGIINKTSINLRQVVSLETDHIEIIRKLYAVTDKADGERHIMIIYNKKLYLMTALTHTIKYTGLELEDESYNGTLLDGEYVYIKEYNRYVYLIFDCLYTNGQSLIKKELTKRLEIAQNIAAKCMKNEDLKYKIIENDSMTKIIDKHRGEIKKYLSIFRSLLSKKDNSIIMCTKYFIPATGIDNTEIFQYSILLWSLYNKYCPYKLDGLIYQSLINERGVDYKWKPPNENSIDFYIEFIKDDSGKDIISYDDTYEETKDRKFKICILHVDDNVAKNKHIPVPFMENQNKHIAFLFLKDNETKDINDNIINDKTVVEFYHNKSYKCENIRWTPIRTRYDKTDSLLKYGKPYGNNKNVAEKIWKSIIDPVELSDLKLLAEKSNYVIDNKLQRTQQYYEIQTNIAMPMKKMHNFIKTNMIDIYTASIFYNKKKINIFDIACGRGGDVNKFIAKNNIDLYVGIDIDAKGIEEAKERYENNKHKKIDMKFINADATHLLKIGDQKSITNIDTELFSKYVENKKYDLINCQFAVHYFLKNEDTWNNFCLNLNNLINNAGYLLITTFDGDYIYNLLKKKNSHTMYYHNNVGDKITMFDIKKKFSKKENIGCTIDVFNSLISNENVYISEYLVFYDFFISELKKKCGLSLVESCTFENLHQMNKQFFESFHKYETVYHTQNYYKLISEFYNLSNDINNSSYNFSILNRCYIFKKMQPK